MNIFIFRSQNSPRSLIINFFNLASLLFVLLLLQEIYVRCIKNQTEEKKMIDIKEKKEKFQENLIINFSIN